MKIYDNFPIESILYLRDGGIDEYDGVKTILAVMMNGVPETSMQSVMRMLAEEMVRLIDETPEYHVLSKEEITEALAERISSAYYHYLRQGEIK